ncbi:TatD family hydrolase [Thalassotalea litorea]|uniref:TatD family hydrolase n=1 Tax=Thalassotalea litorea TaxID=2020715 RepID=UPI0014852973|nr:TatD family hydrolase [Thalassotalea litorea]
MKFTDSHCHLDFADFDQSRPTLIHQLTQSGIGRIIIPGVSAKHWQRQLDTCGSFSGCYFGFGIHPWWINNARQDDLTKLERYLSTKSRVVALGEIGLDAHIDDMDKQIRFFEQQLSLANTLALPVLIHHRQTHHLIIPILKQMRLTHGGVIHAFSGSYQQAKQYLGLGFKLGIGGVITYERAKKTRHAVAKLPLDSLVLETDAPSMPLQGQQGQANSPTNVVKVFQHLCDLREEPPTKIAAQIEQNCEQLFTF